MIQGVSAEAGTAEAAVATAASGRGRRAWLAAGVATLVVVAVAVTILVRHSALTTPESFAASAQRLDALPAPAGSFTPYDPSLDGYLGSAADGSWSRTGTGSGTWSDTSDPGSWVAVRGWETTVAAGQGPASCRAVLDWFATAGPELGLTTVGETEDQATCLSVLDTVTSGSGNENDAWLARGLQTGDGRLRYRLGAETFTGSRPGLVVLRVVADATVVNP